MGNGVAVWNAVGAEEGSGKGGLAEEFPWSQVQQRVSTLAAS